MAPRKMKTASKSMKSSTKSKEAKSSKDDPLHYTKVRDLMKKHNVKNLSNETLHMVAAELNVPLNGMQDQRRLRGKMLAAVKNWDKK